VVLEAGGLEGRFQGADVQWTAKALRIRLTERARTGVPDG